MPNNRRERRSLAGIEYAPTRQNAVASTSSTSSSWNFWARPTPRFVPVACNHSDSQQNHTHDERLKWSVGWSTVPVNGSEAGDEDGKMMMRHTTQYGAWVEFRFNGSAIEVLAPPTAPHHTMYVVLDHDAAPDGACSSPCRWRATGLGRTEHTIRIENFYEGKELGRPLDLSGFSVYPHRPTLFGFAISPSTADRKSVV